MKANTKKLAFLGMCTCISLMLSYIESVIPPIYPAVPGIKIGLPNIMCVFALYRYGAKEAVAISSLRILLSALLFGNPWSLAYSAAGAFLSLVIMMILKKTGIFSATGVSIAGGVSHNAGQIILAAIVLSTKEIGYYMIILAISGTLAGIAVGLISSLMLKYIKIAL